MQTMVSRLGVSDAIFARCLAALNARFPLEVDPPETQQQRYNRAVRTMLRDMIRRVEQDAAAATVVPPPEEAFPDG